MEYMHFLNTEPSGKIGVEYNSKECCPVDAQDAKNI